MEKKTRIVQEYNGKIEHHWEINEIVMGCERDTMAHWRDINGFFLSGQHMASREIIKLNAGILVIAMFDYQRLSSDNDWGIMYKL